SLLHQGKYELDFLFPQFPKCTQINSFFSFLFIFVEKRFSENIIETKPFLKKKDDEDWNDDDVGHFGDPSVCCNCSCGCGVLP
ncbi:MAG: hypothetical protein Q8P67_03910, partial [archaeon]|nr:hypothetical protein [archaeon]